MPLDDTGFKTKKFDKDGKEVDESQGFINPLTALLRDRKKTKESSVNSEDKGNSFENVLKSIAGVFSSMASIALENLKQKPKVYDDIEGARVEKASSDGGEVWNSAYQNFSLIERAKFNLMNDSKKINYIHKNYDKKVTQSYIATLGKHTPTKRSDFKNENAGIVAQKLPVDWLVKKTKEINYNELADYSSQTNYFSNNVEGTSTNSKEVETTVNDEIVVSHDISPISNGEYLNNQLRGAQSVASYNANLDEDRHQDVVSLDNSINGEVLLVERDDKLKTIELTSIDGVEDAVLEPELIENSPHADHQGDKEKLLAEATQISGVEKEEGIQFKSRRSPYINANSKEPFLSDNKGDLLMNIEVSGIKKQPRAAINGKPRIKFKKKNVATAASDLEKVLSEKIDFKAKKNDKKPLFNAGRTETLGGIHNDRSKKGKYVPGRKI